ncbi:MAG TPA: hydrogenase maturation protease [Candidatus Acidoferrales bacterium]|nr:hydrogenase maturation protease [Candidatus Acidoferrales bacterium]
MRIIGCGNLHRGDDAAGIIAAERLRELGVDAAVCVGGFAQLMDMWHGSDDVIIIDAVVTGASAGTVHLWDASDPLPFSKSSASIHGMGIAEAIELSRALKRLPARLQIYGIEGRNFELGSAPLPEVVEATEEVVRRIAGLMQSRSEIA